MLSILVWPKVITLNGFYCIQKHRMKYNMDNIVENGNIKKRRVFYIKKQRMLFNVPVFFCILCLFIQYHPFFLTKKTEEENILWPHQEVRVWTRPGIKLVTLPSLVWKLQQLGIPSGNPLSQHPPHLRTQLLVQVAVRLRPHDLPLRQIPGRQYSGSEQQQLKPRRRINRGQGLF